MDFMLEEAEIEIGVAIGCWVFIPAIAAAGESGRPAGPILNSMFIPGG